MLLLPVICPGNDRLAVWHPQPCLLFEFRAVWATLPWKTSALCQRARIRVWIHLQPDSLVSTLRLESQDTGFGAILIPSLRRCPDHRGAGWGLWPRQGDAGSRAAAGATSSTESWACEGQHSWRNLRSSSGHVAVAKKARQREQCPQSCPRAAGWSGGCCSPRLGTRYTHHSPHHSLQLSPSLKVYGACTSWLPIPPMLRRWGGGLLGPSFHPECFILFLFMAVFKETTTAGGRYMVVSTYCTGYSSSSWKVKNICTSAFWLCRRTMMPSQPEAADRGCFPGAAVSTWSTRHIPQPLALLLSSHFHISGLRRQSYRDLPPFCGVTARKTEEDDGCLLIAAKAI